MDKKYTRQYAIDKVKEFAFLLKQNNIRISGIYLFGSFAKDDNKDFEWSDIDVAVISDDFCGYRMEDNKRLIPLAVKIERRIETHPFTVKDFENSPFVLDEIKKKGLLINIQ
ncbi:MAG: nucleotidyltransferase domain-containing protein [Melioribacteraceae bacterium]